MANGTIKRTPYFYIKSEQKNIVSRVFTTGVDCSKEVVITAWTQTSWDLDRFIPYTNGTLWLLWDTSRENGTAISVQMLVYRK